MNSPDLSQELISADILVFMVKTQATFAYPLNNSLFITLQQSNSPMVAEKHTESSIHYWEPRGATYL